nr:MAG TPA: hypothetical protein [Caudoviricetes sp.]
MDDKFLISTLTVHQFGRFPNSCYGLGVCFL